jgi:hypothetical protein
MSPYPTASQRLAFSTTASPFNATLVAMPYRSAMSRNVTVRNGLGQVLFSQPLLIANLSVYGTVNPPACVANGGAYGGAMCVTYLRPRAGLAMCLALDMAAPLGQQYGGGCTFQSKRAAEAMARTDDDALGYPSALRPLVLNASVSYVLGSTYAPVLPWGNATFTLLLRARQDPYVVVLQDSGGTMAFPKKVPALYVRGAPMVALGVLVLAPLAYLFVRTAWRACRDSCESLPDYVPDAAGGGEARERLDELEEGVDMDGEDEPDPGAGGRSLQPGGILPALVATSLVSAAGKAPGCALPPQEPVATLELPPGPKLQPRPPRRTMTARTARKSGGAPTNVACDAGVPKEVQATPPPLMLTDGAGAAAAAVPAAQESERILTTPASLTGCNATGGTAKGTLPQVAQSTASSDPSFPDNAPPSSLPAAGESAAGAQAKPVPDTLSTATAAGDARPLPKVPLPTPHQQLSANPPSRARVPPLLAIATRSIHRLFTSPRLSRDTTGRVSDGGASTARSADVMLAADTARGLESVSASVAGATAPAEALPPPPRRTLLRHVSSGSVENIDADEAFDALSWHVRLYWCWSHHAEEALRMLDAGVFECSWRCNEASVVPLPAGGAGTGATSDAAVAAAAAPRQLADGAVGSIAWSNSYLDEQNINMTPASLRRKPLPSVATVSPGLGAALAVTLTAPSAAKSATGKRFALM